MTVDEDDQEPTSPRRGLCTLWWLVPLSGLLTALGLAGEVLERAGAERPSGAAMRVDADLVLRLTGRPRDER